MSTPTITVVVIATLPSAYAHTFAFERCFRERHLALKPNEDTLIPGMAIQGDLNQKCHLYKGEKLKKV